MELRKLGDTTVKVATLVWASPDQVRALAEEAVPPGDRKAVFGETACRI